MRNFFFTAPTTAILLVSIVAAQAETTSHSTHDHGDEASSQESSHTTSSHESHEGEHFEAAAVYDVEAGNNSFIAIPAEGAFEEESLAFMIVPAASADEEGLEGAEEDAEAGKSVSLGVSIHRYRSSPSTSGVVPCFCCLATRKLAHVRGDGASAFFTFHPLLKSYSSTVAQQFFFSGERVIKLQCCSCWPELYTERCVQQSI